MAHDRNTTSPDVLLIGNVTRDLIDPADFQTYRLGGTVTFAAAVAERLGRQPTVITYAAPDTDFSALPPSTALHLLPSTTTTNFRQHLHLTRAHPVLLHARAPHRGCGHRP